MNYLSKKKTLALILISLTLEVGVYLIPIFLQNMLLQKIITIAYLALGTLLGVAFFLVNGASTAVIDGEYEKNFMKALREGKAEGEGENFHWNPLKISLAKRVYYSKIILSLLLPIFVVFFMEYIALLISQFTD